MPAAPLITDEPVDHLVSRPLARLVVKALAPTRVSANQVTGAAALTGIALGVCLGQGWGLAAAALVAAYLTLDCVDGQLARLRGGGGYLGRALDGWGDYLTGVAVHLGLAVWIADGQGWPAAAALTLMGAFAMTWASFLLDRYKRRYNGTTDDVEAIRREAAERGGLAGRMVAGMLPYAERLDDGMVVADLATYQARARGAMRLWLLNGPTMHFTVLAVCSALGRPALYAFLAAGPMLLVTLLSLWVQQRAEAGEPPVVARSR